MAVSKTAPTSTAQTIPHLRGLPLIGVLPQLLRSNPFEYLRQIVVEHGDLVTLQLGPQKIYLVSSADYLQRILRDNYLNYRKPEMFYKTLAQTLGNGLVTSTGDFWLRQRRMIQPHLHRKQLRHLLNEMIAATHNVIDSWKSYALKGETVDIAAEMSHITMDVILRTMFGNDVLPETEMAEVAHQMECIVGHIGRKTITGVLPDWLPIHGNKKYEEAYQVVKSAVMKLIEGCRQQGDSAPGLIKMLFDAVDEETNERMTDQQLFDEVITIFLAGFETTATALGWLWTVLQRHPEIEANLREEVETVLGSRIPGFEDLPRLEYTRKVFMETMRMYTVAPMLPRMTVEADCLGEYEIPARALLLMYFHGLHHNPRLWDDPEKFDPERFVPDRMAQYHPFAYLPFSGGPRKCAGDEFAMMEGPLVMAMILQRYQIQVLPGQDLTPMLGATMRLRHGLKVTLKLRE